MVSMNKFIRLEKCFRRRSLVEIQTSKLNNFLVDFHEFILEKDIEWCSMKRREREMDKTHD